MFERVRLTLLKADLAFIKAIRALRVKARFFMMVITISIIPILVVGIISYKKADIDIVSKISYSSEQLVEQIAGSADQKLLNWEQYGDIIAVSKDVQGILTEYENKNMYDYYLPERALENIMTETLKVSLDLQEPDMITSHGEVICPNTNTKPFVNNMDEVELNWLKKATLEADGSYIWYTGEVAQGGSFGYTVLSRSIKDVNTFKRSLGILMLQVDNNYLYDLYKDVNLGKGSKVYVLDSNYMILSSADRKEVGTILSPEITKGINYQYSKGVFNSTVKNVDSQYMVAFSRIPTAGWTVVSLIPNSYLYGLSSDIRSLVIVVGIICLIVSLFFFTMIYRSITLPLGQLISSMREVKKGNLKWQRVDEDANDEVGEVTVSYNKMIYELNQHIEDIKSKEKQKAEAEFRALQAQINPHFIANTLNNVVWMAKMQKAENIETVVNSLVQLLNSSMGRGGDIIIIREEVQNLRSYISIQEFKYFKKIEVFFDLDDDIMDLKILRFVLQPIIENSFIHGIGPKQGQGYISLKGYIDREDIVIIVTDNGVGMNEDEIANLLNTEKGSKDQFNSIGLKNVHERIILSYGENYGIRIKSQKDMFTSVEIKLPVIS